MLLLLLQVYLMLKQLTGLNDVLTNRTLDANNTYSLVNEL